MILDAYGNLQVSSGSPAIVQKISTTGTGSQASLQSASLTVTAGNTLVVTVGTGSVTSVAVTDTLGNQYIFVNGTASNVPGSWVFYSPNIKVGANQVTVTPSGSTSIAFEVYEVSGIVSPQGGWPTTTVASPTVFGGSNVVSAAADGSGTAASTTSPNVYIGNLICFSALALATTNSTPTAFQPWTKDSDQVIGGTPSGLVGFHSFSTAIGSPVINPPAPLTFGATITSAPWSNTIIAFAGYPVKAVAINSPLDSGGNLSVNIQDISGSTVVTAATGVQKVGIVGTTGGTLDGPIGTTAPTRALWTTNAPATASAAAVKTTYINSTASAVIKASGANLYGVWLLQTSTTSSTTATTALSIPPMYIQFFNTTTTATLTTTAWLFSLPISGAGGSIEASCTIPLAIHPGALALANFSNGIVIVVNTTSTSATTASGTACVGTIWYD